MVKTVRFGVQSDDRGGFELAGKALKPGFGFDEFKIEVVCIFSLDSVRFPKRTCHT